MTSPRSATSTAAGRIYDWDGETFPSVTTVLGTLAKPGLTRAAARVTARLAVEQLPAMHRQLAEGEDARVIAGGLSAAYQKEWDRASMIGTAVHAGCEALAIDYRDTGTVGEIPLAAVTLHATLVAAESAASLLIDPPASADLEPFVRQFGLFLNEWRPRILAIEAEAYNRAYNYAGSMDLLLEIDGQVIVADIKTGSNVEKYGETAAQLCMYANAEFIGESDGTERPMPHVDRGWILKIRPRTRGVFECRIDAEVFHAALALRKVWQATKDFFPTAIDQRPLAPPQRSAA